MSELRIWYCSLGGFFPVYDIFDVFFSYVVVIAVSDGTFEKHSDAEWQFRDSGIVEFVEIIVTIGFS